MMNEHSDDRALFGEVLLQVCSRSYEQPLCEQHGSMQASRRHMRRMERILGRRIVGDTYRTERRRIVLSVLIAATILLTCCTVYAHSEDIRAMLRELTATYVYRESHDSSDGMLTEISTVPRIQVYDGGVYFYNGAAVVRFDTQEGEIQYQCNDPSCLHAGTDGCCYEGYYEPSAFIVTEEGILYRQYARTFQGTQSDIVLYRTQDGTLTVLDRQGSQKSGTVTISHSDVLYGKWYFFLQARDEDEDGADLCVIDRSTGVKMVLASYAWGETYSPMFAYADTLYFWHRQSGTIYAAPVDDPLAMEPIASGGWYMTLDTESGAFYALDKEAGTVFRSAAPGETETIPGIDNADYMYMTDGYLYYARVYETVRVPYEYGGDREVTLHEYYRCSHEGQNHELIYREEQQQGAATLCLKDFVVDGNYLYASWHNEDFSNEGKQATVQENDSVVVRVDVETGEVYYLPNG